MSVVAYSRKSGLVLLPPPRRRAARAADHACRARARELICDALPLPCQWNRNCEPPLLGGGPAAGYGVRKRARACRERAERSSPRGRLGVLRGVRCGERHAPRRTPNCSACFKPRIAAHSPQRSRAAYTTRMAGGAPTARRMQGVRCCCRVGPATGLNVHLLLSVPAVAQSPRGN